MLSMTSEVATPDGTIIYVETIEIVSAPPPPESRAPGSVEGPPTKIGFSDTLSMLRDAVSAIGGSLRGALGKARPDEMTVTLKFVLKGEVNLIPVLVQGSGDGSIKVELKWRASQNVESAES
jgi:hypothetical protein